MKSLIATAAALAAVGSQEQPLAESWHPFAEQQQQQQPAEVTNEVILDQVKSVRSHIDEQFADIGNFQKETKTALEELTKAKNSFAGLSSDLETVQQTMKRLQLQLGRERQLAYGNPIERIARDPEKRARFNAAVRLAVSDHRGDLDETAKAICKELGIEAKALGEDTSPGSTVIDDALANEIYDSLEMYGAWATLGVRRLGTKQTKFPVKTARPIAYYLLTEADTIADDANKAGTSVTAEAEIIACLINVSLQLLQDSTFDVTRDVMDDFIQAFNYRLDYSAFQGAGTATGTAAKLHGGVTGLANFATAHTLEATENTMEEADLENFMSMLTTVDVEVLNRGAQWWLHPFHLVRTLAIKDSNGRPIFLTALEAPAPGKIGSILGYPVNPVNAMPSANTAGTKVAVFGDPSAYIVGIRQDFQFEASDHARWTTYQRSFRGVGRATGKGRKASALASMVLGSAT